jgi:acetyl esterase/lipase
MNDGRGAPDPAARRLRAVLVLAAPGGAADAARAAPWPAVPDAGLRIETTDRPDEARRAIESGAVDAVAAALEAPRDDALARQARALAARDRWVDYTPARIGRAGDGCICGRGEFSLPWALNHLLTANAHPYERIAYGPDPDQVADLRLPAPGAAPPPLVVLLHGGFWREAYRRDVMAALAVDLAARGIATWNVEYRRVGGGGGCPRTFEDVAAALDLTAHLTRSRALDPRAPVVLGHSAGGHLALWCAARARLAADRPGGAPRVVPARVVAIGAVADLAAARRANLGAGAVDAFVPDAADEAWTNPRALLPLGVPQLIAHGTLDESVPCALGAGYAEAARAAGDDVDWLPLADATHMPPIDPRGDPWRRILDALLPHLDRR